ncbi:MAG: hypothetical protein AAF810_02285 [Cyanobacteria bacterium P01_D01_bin.36]
MSLDFYPAKIGLFTNSNNGIATTVKADEPAEDYSDVLSFNQSTAAKLIPLLSLPVEDGYGEIAAADLYQRCFSALHLDKSALEEFTCAEDAFLAQILAELGADADDGPSVINIGTDSNTAKGLRRRILQLHDLALLTMQRHGSKGIVQMC